MTVKYTLSNHLHVTGLSSDIKDFYRSYCQYNTDTMANKDIPPDLNLFKEHEDGSISIPRGLESQLLHYLSVKGITVERVMDVAPVQKFDFQVKSNINYTSGIFGYQDRVVQELLKHNTGRLESPTGSGKTAMACLAAAFSKEGPVLFLVPTDRLLNQFINTVPKVLGIPKEDVGIIKAQKRVIKPITVGSLKTLNSKTFKLADYKNTFSTVFMDECHIASALTYRTVLLSLAPKRLYGLSATPEHYSSDELNRLLESIIGPIVTKITPDELPSRLIPEIFTRETGCTFEYYDTAGQSEAAKHMSRHKLLNSIKNHSDRNNLIVQDSVNLVNLGFKLLISVSRVEHAKILTDLLALKGIKISFPYKKSHITKEKKGKKVKVDSFTVDHKQLNLDVDAIDSGELQGIAGTYGLFGTGFDCPILGAVILASPFSGRNTTLAVQVAGRVQRHYYGKESAVLLDYSDDSAPNNSLRTWSNDRAKVLFKKFGNRDIIY